MSWFLSVFVEKLKKSVLETEEPHPKGKTIITAFGNKDTPWFSEIILKNDES